MPPILTEAPDGRAVPVEERRVSHGNVAATGLHRDVVVAGRDRAALDANLGDRGLQNHVDEFSNFDKPCQILHVIAEVSPKSLILTTKS